jgi:hypothetical protein
MKKTALPLKLARPAQRALAAAGIDCLEKLAEYSEKQVMDLHGIGANAMLALKTAMRENKLQFAVHP